MVASGHVDPSTLWSLVAGELDHEQLAHLSSHLDVCSGWADEGSGVVDVEQRDLERTEAGEGPSDAFEERTDAS